MTAGAPQGQVPPRRVRVLFAIGSMGGGGAERQILAQLQRLDRHRFTPVLALAHRTGELLPHVPDDVPIYSFWEDFQNTVFNPLCKLTRSTMLARWVFLASVLRREQIDVICDRTYLATLDTAGACLFRRTPRLSCAVVDPEPELQLYRRLPGRWSWRLARWAYATATRVLANSEGLAQHMQAYFQLPAGRVELLRNVLDLETVCRRASEPLPPALQVPSSAGVRLITVGRLHPQKGHRTLIDAVALLKRTQPVHLQIVGEGPIQRELQSYIDQLQLQQSVALTGFCENPLPLVAAADIFVLPSLYEGSPNALIEACALGRPAVSTDCPSGPSEIFAGTRGGWLVPVGNAAALAETLATVIAQPAEAARRAAFAKQRVRELFSPAMNLARLEDLLLAAVGQTDFSRNTPHALCGSQE